MTLTSNKDYFYNATNKMKEMFKNNWEKSDGKVVIILVEVEEAEGSFKV